MIELELTYECFKAVVGEVAPEVSILEKGCIKEVRSILASTPGLRDRLAEYVRRAPGNRAGVIFHLRLLGWWSDETYVEDMRQAPGGRAEFIYLSRIGDWWPADDYMRDVRQAPGNQAWVIRRSLARGWWPKDTYEADMRDAMVAEERE